MIPEFVAARNFSIMSPKKIALLNKSQLVVLCLISLILLVATPVVWNFTPDSGIYIGTAKNIIQDHRYWFNAQPNLQYYPGYPLLLIPLISLAGLNFHVLNLFAVSIVISAAWMIRAYFPVDRYGYVGFLSPFVFVSSGLVLQNVFHILSDIPFIALSMLALLAWREWRKQGSRIALAILLIVAAYLPLLRFQGLLFLLALGLSYGILVITENNQVRLRCFSIGVFFGILVFTPFALWTWRNYLLYTPDTFNMANAFFFGKKGLALYAPYSHSGEANLPIWQYTLHRFYQMFLALEQSFLGRSINQYVGVGLLVVWLILGQQAWWRRANMLERSYVLLSLLFILYSLVSKGETLYVVPRYWLPVLPFLIVALGFGLVAFGRGMRRFTSVRLLPLLVVLILWKVGLNAKQQFLHNLAIQDEYGRAAVGLSELSKYVELHLPKQAVVGVSDWGVIPLYLERTAILLLNDENHKMSVSRMRKYHVGYVAVMDRVGAASESTQQMVDEYPGAFNKLYDYGVDGKPVLGLYKVNLELLPNE